MIFPVDESGEIYRPCEETQSAFRKHGAGKNAFEISENLKVCQCEASKEEETKSNQRSRGEKKCFLDLSSSRNQWAY